jgi:hypothetical protein
VVNYYPFRLTFREWLRMVFTRRFWLAVAYSDRGEVLQVTVVSKPPKGAKPLTAEAMAAQARRFAAARQQLEERMTAQGGTGRFTKRKGGKKRR